MGVNSSSLSREQLAEYADLTHFSEGEIVDLKKKFDMLNPKVARDESDRRVSPSQLKKMPELNQNPFLSRLCRIFSSSRDNTDSLSFEDFLDMMNVLSEHAPLALKSHYAFLLFDFNENGYVDAEDIQRTISCITADDKGLDNEEMTNNLIASIMREADLDQDNQLGRPEFEHVLSKSPDFINSFKIRL